MTVLHFKKPVNPFWCEYSPFPTPLGIAVHLGWLNGVTSADGIAIKSIHGHQLPSDPTQRQEYILTHTFRQGSSIPAIWAKSRGADTRVIGLSWTDESQKILTLSDTKISRIKDLRGLRVAIANDPDNPINMFRATSLRGFLSALDLEGLSSNDVEFVYIKKTPNASLYVDEVNALLQKKVDAIYVRGAPGIDIFKKYNLKEIIDIGFHPDPYIRMNNGTPRPLTVHNDLLENFPDIVTGFLQLVTAAGIWTRTHSQECISFIAHQTKTSPESVISAYGKNLHNNLHVNLSATAITALKHFKDFLLEWHFIQHDFDVNNWIAPEPLLLTQSKPALKRG